MKVKLSGLTSAYGLGNSLIRRPTSSVVRHTSCDLRLPSGPEGPRRGPFGSSGLDFRRLARSDQTKATGRKRNWKPCLFSEKLKGRKKWCWVTDSDESNIKTRGLAGFRFYHGVSGSDSDRGPGPFVLGLLQPHKIAGHVPMLCPSRVITKPVFSLGSVSAMEASKRPYDIIEMSPR